jgi:hypothetical protein
MNKMAPVNKTVFQIVIASKRPKNYCWFISAID